ncbi:hypothetical protein [Shimazuella kribbensis]|uniref:hypothetical protein n=1 Tax=Shimazuella kribbensis TaxID=139808 RepID=UPI0003F55181|nr:hypothetical protein [Shimazuella kribbensis]
MSILSSVIGFLIEYRFILFFVFLFAGLACCSFIINFIGDKWGIGVSITIILACIGFLVFGTEMNNAFLKANGTKADALITEIELTNSTYNDVPISRYHVLIRIAENKTIKTTFEDTNFNIYPDPEDGYQYPNQGEKFTIQYIPGAEGNFLILANDHSPYSKRLSCSAYYNKMMTAKEEYGFSPTNTLFIKKYKNALQTYISQVCDSSDTYQKELDKLQK